MYKIGIFTTHPIQYQVPIWRRLAAEKDLQVKVFYFSDQGVNPDAVDAGFGRAVQWDVPLLDGYEYEFLSRRPIRDKAGFAIPDVEAFFRREKFDAVFSHGYFFAFFRQLCRMKKKFGYKIMLRGEFSDEAPASSLPARVARELYLRCYYPRVDAFGAIGEVSFAHLRKRGIPDRKIFFTPYSIDDQLFKRQQAEHDRASCRAALGLEDDTPAFLFSGKMIPRKAPLLLADAALELAEKYRFAMIFLGDGELLPALRARLEPVFGKRLIAPGFVNQGDLGKYFNAADIFVLPARFDRWGLVVNEAMAFGLPVIVSDRCGCRHDLVKEQTGMVFRDNDTASLRSAMESVLKSPERLPEMGREACRLIERFSSDAAASGIAAGLRTTLK